MLSSPKHNILAIITAPEFSLDFLWTLTFIFLTLAMLCFVGIFLIRNSIGAKAIRTKNKKMEFSPMISEFLFYEESNDIEEKKNYLHLKIEIRELIKDRFDRNVFTEVLMDLRKDLSGESKEALIHLYKDMGLHNDAFENLKSRRWQVVSKGILELSTMEVNESYSLIIKFINHRQSTIRKQAEIAVVNLKEEGITYFLDTTKYKISEWEQLKLLDVLRHKPNFEPPQFSLWLTSKNADVVLFALRLIKYFKQTDAVKSIITLLKHKRRDIRVEAIDCIKEFYFVDALPTLKLVYPKASADVKIAILDTIGEIGSKNDIGFLEIIQKREKNFNINSKVIGMLNKINPESILPTKHIETEAFFTSNLNDNALTEDEIKTVTDEFLEESKDVEADGAITVNENETTYASILGDQDEVTETDNYENIAEKQISMDIVPPVSEENTAFTNSMVEKEDEEENREPLFTLDVSLQEERIDTDSDSTSAANSSHQQEDIDWSQIINKDIPNLQLGHAIQSDEKPFISFENGAISFSANFMDEDELETMVLLENIAEMGDRRELFLLNQLLEENESPLILERANELIEKFSHQLSGPNELFSSDDGLKNSVFTKIFHLSDTATKLILLNEIEDIGDEKEIRLLESLLLDQNKWIAKRAKAIIEHIRNKINEKECSETILKVTLLPVGFELESDQNLTNALNQKRKI